jgi:hypothetical protein
MARMSIDDMLGRDPRLLRLAKACGWSKRETAGCLVLDVWPLCYDRERPEIDDVDIDVAADMDGFAQLMVNAGLATRLKPGKVRISGAKKRVKYLQEKRAAGYRGGIKSAESRNKEVKQNSSKPQAEGKQTSSTGQAAGNPIPTPILTPTATDTPKERAAEPPPLVLVPAEPKSKSPQQQLTDLFFAGFAATTNGSKPTWTEKQAGQIAQLLTKHPLAELVARMEFMFAGKAKWPPPPYTLDTFVSNIDKFVDSQPARPKFQRIPKL